MGKLSDLKETFKIARELYTFDQEARKSDSVDPESEEASNSDVLTRQLGSKNPIRRSTDEDDQACLTLLSTAKGLLEPDWPPQIQYQIFEESDILKAAIRARVVNTERPYDIVYVGPKADEQNKEVQAEKTRIENLFGQCNEKHSFLTVRLKKQLDKEVIHGGFIEVLCDQETLDPNLFYYVPGTWMRVTALDKDPILIFVNMYRDGELKKVGVWRRFRRFCRALPTKELQWFKEFGDPRILNRKTGDYYKDEKGSFILEKDIKEKKLNADTFQDRATEIWWFRDTYGGDIYPVNDWVGAISAIRGAYLAAWCNYDVLDHGGMPPWLLLVFGRLAKGTRAFLDKLVQKWRDPRSYSDPGVLEIEPNLMSFSNTGGTKAGAEFVSMRDMRNEEAMFTKYTDQCRKIIGGVLRVPPVLYGYTEGAGGTNYAAIETFQTQVIEPMQVANDERVNVELIQARLGIYNWKVKTRRTPVGDMEQLYKALGMVSRGGGGSQNDLIEEENRVFGTQWKTREHPFYSDLSAAESIGLIRQGQVAYHLITDEKGGQRYEPEILPPAPANPFGAVDTGGGGGDNIDDGTQGDQAAKADETADQIEKLMPIADTINILAAMEKVEDRIKNYKPKVIEEKDLAL
jgi:capsid portal protein